MERMLFVSIAFARTRRPCTSCLPLGSGKCINSLANRQSKLSSIDTSSDVDISAVCVNLRASDSIDDDALRCDSSALIQVNVSYDSLHTSSSLSSTSDLSIDDLMNQAYGTTLINLVGGNRDTPWCIRQARIIQLSGSHYTLSGGSVGRRYLDTLIDEANHLAAGNYPSERVLVCGSVILQCDKSVKKGADIRHLLKRRITLWQQDNFYLLLQEAERCDKTFQRTRNRVPNQDAVVQVFSQLVLQGKLKAAVRWATETARGIVLSPCDLASGCTDGSTLLDVLCWKHPDPHPPVPATFLHCDVLPQLEEVEITGCHVLLSVRQIQGGVGPGGCDACHWQDVLLRYGAHSSHLRDAVAALSRRLVNTLLPWDQVRALVSNHLIALEKYPGVRLVWCR